MSDDLLDSSAGELVAAIAARRVSAVELTDAAIARIETRDGAINAVVVRDFDRARAAARKADEALARGKSGALLGLPMTVKESHDVAGLPTTWGFEHARDFVPAQDSVGVARLKAAGAIILGKTNVPTGLSDWQSVNAIHGRTHNPHDPSRSAGGSSGGAAAALAAGMVPLEFGSDIGGSIRVPAAFCGVYGHKPSWELIPLRGHAPPGVDGPPPPLSVVGPMARTAGDLELALDVLAGPDVAEAKAYRLDLPAARGERLSDFRILMLDGLAPTDAEVAGAMAELTERLARAGATIARERSLLPDFAAAMGLYRNMLITISSARTGQPAPFDAHGWMRLLAEQAKIRRQWATLFESVDVVIAPTLGVPAFPHVDEPDLIKRVLTIDGQDTPYFAQLAWAAPATLAHLPATAAPIAMTKGGLPIGAQIIGPYLEDRTPLRFAALMEREFGGFQRPKGS